MRSSKMIERKFRNGFASLAIDGREIDVGLQTVEHATETDLQAFSLEFAQAEGLRDILGKLLATGSNIINEDRYVTGEQNIAGGLSTHIDYKHAPRPFKGVCHSQRSGDRPRDIATRNKQTPGKTGGNLACALDGHRDGDNVGFNCKVAAMVAKIGSFALVRRREDVEKFSLRGGAMVFSGNRDCVDILFDKDCLPCPERCLEHFGDQTLELARDNDVFHGQPRLRLRLSDGTPDACLGCRQIDDPPLRNPRRPDDRTAQHPYVAAANVETETRRRQAGDRTGNLLRAQIHDRNDVIPRLERPEPRRTAQGLPPLRIHKARPFRCTGTDCPGSEFSEEMALSRLATVGSRNCKLVRLDRRKSMVSRAISAIFALARSDSSRSSTSAFTF